MSSSDCPTHPHPPVISSRAAHESYATTAAEYNKLGSFKWQINKQEKHQWLTTVCTEYFTLTLFSTLTWVHFIPFISRAKYYDFMRFSLYPLCVLTAQVAKVYPHPLLPHPAQWGNWHEEASSQSPPLPFSCNWIMSDDAFYTAVDWFILKVVTISAKCWY